MTMRSAMSNSGRKINYGVRPAKSIERKMMRDLMNRLSTFGPLSDYRYIGFGAKYFIDFVLFHKYLDIQEMISIEGDLHNTDRYNFNKPFNTIQILTGKSTDVLPTLKGSTKKSIFWLDYDGRFEKYMMDDVAIVTRDIGSGGLLSLSFNCDGLLVNPMEPDIQSIQDQLTTMVGEEYVSQVIDTKGWGKSSHVAKFLQETLYDKIRSVLKSRNIGKAPLEAMTFEQVLFFNYADNAKMTTFSYVFFLEKDRQLFINSRMSDLYFFRNTSQAFDIKVPNLTLKEIRHVMEVMPDKTQINDKVFAISDVDALWTNYRYFPSFTELETY